MINVTLIMPMRNEAADLPDVLSSLDAQTYHHDRMRLILVDGRSNDGSREIAESWFAGSDIAGEIATNGRGTIPSSLNIGLQLAAPGDMIVRLDAHTTYAPDYVQTLVHALERESLSVACIGGAQTPAPESAFGRALVASLYTNPLGLGGASFRRATMPRFVNGVYLGAWRPGVLQAVGGFDEAWEANEDGELAARLRLLGYRTKFVPAASSYRVKRQPLDAVAQWGRYGYWRAQTLRRHPQELRLRHLAPPLAIALTALLVLTPLRAVAAVLYAAYAVAIVMQRAPGESPLVTLAAFAFYPACQAAWGIGLIRGLLSAPFAGASRAVRSHAALAAAQSASDSHRPR